MQHVHRDSQGFEVDSDGDYVLKNHTTSMDKSRQAESGTSILSPSSSPLGFISASQTDEWVLFTRGKNIYVLYTDDSILTGPDEAKLEQVVQIMKDANLDLTVEGDVSDFLGVNIKRHQDGTVYLTQPHLIDSLASQRIGSSGSEHQWQVNACHFQQATVVTRTFQNLMNISIAGESLASSTTLKRALGQT